MGGKRSFDRYQKDTRTGLQKQADKLLAQTEDSAERTASKLIRESLFQKQKEVIDNPSEHKVVCCSRRSGKTQMLERYMLMTALEYPKVEILYIGQDQKSAKDIVWSSTESIPALIQEYKLGSFCRLNFTLSTIEFDNGSIIKISGADTKEDVRKLQGRKYKLVVIDEAQDIKDPILSYLINEILSPAMVDLQGTIVLAGVPKPLMAGIFYNAAELTVIGIDDKEYSWDKFSWNIFQNPMLKLEDTWAMIYKELALSGEKIEDPNPQRKYYGKWVREDKAQLYAYMQGRNDYTTLPITDDLGKIIRWSYVLGIDLGYRDLTTFTIFAWSKQYPESFCIESYGKAQMLDNEMAEIIKEYRKKYGTMKIVADKGALGLRVIENFMHVYGVFIEPAEKTEKAATIRLMNTFFRRGLIKLNPKLCPHLINQLQRLEIDPLTQYEEKTAACDYADSCLYAWRHTYSFLHKPKPQTLTPEDQAIYDARKSYEKALADVNKTEGDKVREETEQYWKQQEKLFTHFW